VLGVRLAWVAGTDGETGKSGYDLLPHFLGVDSGSLH